ncbi:hypothetical protein L3Q82_016693 [Scortum barcoo]|uniref:Uncharacterized protein n=1 Tax=Scortum barcoo TaxID=214431 RepID=A0ACB8X7R5_9TELE|nr:hypothetical protein L3Q82_016693 [Scortum barcoo]
MSHREEAPGKTQDTLERLCLSAGLGTPRGPPEELEEVSGVREVSGIISAQTAASATRPRIKRMKMDGWMDGWMRSGSQETGNEPLDLVGNKLAPVESASSESTLRVTDHAGVQSEERRSSPLEKSLVGDSVLSTPGAALTHDWLSPDRPSALR